MPMAMVRETLVFGMERWAQAVADARARPRSLSWPDWPVSLLYRRNIIIMVVCLLLKGFKPGLVRAGCWK
jgi:hypothetical protein